MDNTPGAKFEVAGVTIFNSEIKAAGQERLCVTRTGIRFTVPMDLDAPYIDQIGRAFERTADAAYHAGRFAVQREMRAALGFSGSDNPQVAYDRPDRPHIRWS